MHHVIQGTGDARSSRMWFLLPFFFKIRLFGFINVFQSSQLRCFALVSRAFYHSFNVFKDRIQRDILVTPQHLGSFIIRTKTRYSKNLPVACRPLLIYRYKCSEPASDNIFVWQEPQGCVIGYNYHVCQVSSLHLSHVCWPHRSPAFQTLIHFLTVARVFRLTHTLAFHTPCHVPARADAADIGFHVLDDVFVVVQRADRRPHRQQGSRLQFQRQCRRIFQFGNAKANLSVSMSVSM